MGVAATVAPKCQGPQDPTKELAGWMDLLGQPLKLENMFSQFSGLNPPPPNCGKCYGQAGFQLTPLEVQRTLLNPKIGSKRVQRTSNEHFLILEFELC